MTLKAYYLYNRLEHAYFGLQRERATNVLSELLNYKYLNILKKTKMYCVDMLLIISSKIG